MGSPRPSLWSASSERGWEGLVAPGVASGPGSPQAVMNSLEVPGTCCAGGLSFEGQTDFCLFPPGAWDSVVAPCAQGGTKISGVLPLFLGFSFEEELEFFWGVCAHGLAWAEISHLRCFNCFWGWLFPETFPVYWYPPLSYVDKG